MYKVGRRCQECSVKIKKNNKFCSHKCYTNSLRERLNMICKECSEVFEVVKSTLKKGGGVFCCVKCQRTYWKKNRKTRAEVMRDYNAKEEVILRKRLWQEEKDYDGNATLIGKHCKICGIKKDRMAIHHIDGKNGKHGRELNNNADNLVVLCQSCHAKIHNKWYLKEVVFSNV